MDRGRRRLSRESRRSEGRTGGREQLRPREVVRETGVSTAPDDSKI